MLIVKVLSFAKCAHKKWCKNTSFLSIGNDFLLIYEDIFLEIMKKGLIIFFEPDTDINTRRSIEFFLSMNFLCFAAFKVTKVYCFISFLKTTKILQ